MPVKQRLHHFDILKGIAIFMVVMGHVITFCIRDIDRAAVFKFIGNIHMPLFFFISGWFIFKPDITRSGDIVMPKLKKRIMQLLVPMVVCSSLWVWYFPHAGIPSPIDSTFSGLWHDSMKNGYWFTFVLLEIILIYCALVPLLRHARTWYASAGISLFAWGILWLILACMTPELRGITSFELTFAFFPIFMFGMIASRYRDAFNRIVKNQWVVTAALTIGAVTLYVQSWYWEFPMINTLYLGPVLHICLAITGIAVVEPWSRAAFAPELSRPKPLAGMWEYIGRKSLAIYLLHYFFLFPCMALSPVLHDMNVGFVPVTATAAVIAAVIISFVLATDYILSKAKPLSFLLTGSV